MKTQSKPFIKKLVPLATLAGLGALMAPTAHAAAIDVSSVVTEITAQATPVGLIGVAILGLVVIVKAFIWVRGALR